MSEKTPGINLSEEEIAKILAVEKVKNEYNKKEEELDSKEKERAMKLKEKQDELNRIIDEDEALEIISSNKYKMSSFLILYLSLVTIDLFYILYISGHNLNQLGYALQFVINKALDGEFILLYEIFIPPLVMIIFFFFFMVIFSKIITKIFEGNNNSFFGLFFKKYANIFEITNENILKFLSKKIGKKDDGKKSYFINYITWRYSFLLIYNLFFLKNPYKINKQTKEEKQSYQDENTQIIDTLIKNKGIYTTRLDLATQGRNDKGQFTDKEEKKEYMVLDKYQEVSNGFEYRYVTPMGYNTEILINSEINFIFKQEFKKINKNLTIKISNDSKYCLFKVIDGNIEKKTVSIFQYYLGDNRMIIPELLSDSLEIPIGLDFSGELVKMPSLEKTPHALIAGGTSSGKSVSFGTVVTGYLLLNSPLDLSFVILDPHKSNVSMGLKDSFYNYFKGKIFDKEDFLPLLRVLETELDYRRKLIGDIEGINTLSELNSEALRLKIKKIKRILVSIDEFSSSYSGLSRQEELEAKNILGRIGKEGRKYGIHILAIEQNPIATSFPLDLKKQMGTRICMRVNTVSESNTVLGGAILGETANNIRTKGVALVNFEGSFEGKMKFFVVPQMDKTIKVENNFGINPNISYKDLIHAIEYNIHNIKGLEEEILSSNRITDDFAINLNIDENFDSNNQEVLKDFDLETIKNDISIFKKQYVNLTDFEILCLILASKDGLSRNSWNENFIFIDKNLSFNQYRKQFKLFLDIYGDFFDINPNNQKKTLKLTINETLNSLNILKNENNNN